MLTSEDLSYNFGMVIGDYESEIILPPDALRELSELEQARPTFSPVAQANAKLAYLYGLILSDPELQDLKARLTKLAGHKLAATEDADSLAHYVKNLSEKIGMSPRLLAICAICWAHEAEVHPYEVKGSADWFTLPIHIQNTRASLREEAMRISEEITSALGGMGLDPRSSLRVCIEKSKQLGVALRNLEKEVRGLDERRSTLLSSIHEYQLEAYYLKRIRGKRIDNPQLERLLKLAGTDLNEVMTSKSRRIQMQKTFYDWAEAAERKLDSIIAVWSPETTHFSRNSETGRKRKSPSTNDS